MISNIFSSFKGFTLPAILGTTGVIAGGGYGLVSYLGRDSSNVSPSWVELEEQNIQKDLKLVAEYFQRNEVNNSFTCNSLKTTNNEVNKKEEVNSENCRKFVTSTWGNIEFNNLPTIGLKIVKGSFKNAMESFLFYSENEKFSIPEEHSESWSYGDSKCSNKELDGNIIVSCYKDKEIIKKTRDSDSPEPVN